MSGNGCLGVRGGLLAGLVVGLLACDPYGAYCEEAMDCMGGNEQDVDACVVELEGREEHAALWDCDEYFDALFECLELEADCDNDYYTPDDSCEDEQEDYEACM